MPYLTVLVILILVGIATTHLERTHLLASQPVQIEVEKEQPTLSRK